MIPSKIYIIQTDKFLHMVEPLQEVKTIVHNLHIILLQIKWEWCPRIHDTEGGKLPIYHPYFLIF